MAQWPIYLVVTNDDQSVTLRGVTFDHQSPDSSVPAVNLAAARRTTGRSFIGRTLTIRDPEVAARVVAAAGTQASFVARMADLAAQRKADHEAAQAFELLKSIFASR